VSQAGVIKYLNSGKSNFPIYWGYYQQVSSWEVSGNMPKSAQQYRQVLLEQFAGATNSYSHAIKERQKNRASISQAEYKALSDIVNAAFSECEKIRFALENRHIGASYWEFASNVTR
jgi:hypothetical protein